MADIAEIVGGSTPSTKDESYWKGGEYCWSTPKDLSGNFEKILFETERKVTGKGLSTISSGLLPEGTVLMSSRAPVGYLAIAKVPVSINQGYIAMKCYNDSASIFVLLF
jgi:type I restriction enzyme S subunit